MRYRMTICVASKDPGTLSYKWWYSFAFLPAVNEISHFLNLLKHLVLEVFWVLAIPIALH